MPDYEQLERGNVSLARQYLVTLQQEAFIRVTRTCWTWRRRRLSLASGSRRWTTRSFS
jgi:hypothetical protein